METFLLSTAVLCMIFSKQVNQTIGKHTHIFRIVAHPIPKVAKTIETSQFNCSFRRRMESEDTKDAKTRRNKCLSRKPGLSAAVDSAVVGGAAVVVVVVVVTPPPPASEAPLPALPLSKG